MMAECNELISKTAITMIMVNMKAVMLIVNNNLHWWHHVLQYNSIIIIIDNVYISRII